MIYVFYCLAVLLILQGLFSLWEGILFWRFVRSSLEELPTTFLPRVAIIAPCKGLDPHLDDSLDALFRLDYPDYEIIFAVGSIEDSSIEAIMAAMNRHPKVDARVVTATPSRLRSEKVNNLLVALEAVSSDRETLVFVDSDAKVRPDWLRALVSPLTHPNIGAATGYRWYLPDRVGLLSAALSAWNGSVATTLGDHGHNFAWGGSTAIMRDTFARTRIAQLWQHSVSDDYVLTRAVQESGLHIQFVPRCLTVSREDPALGSLLEFTTRQIVITKVYRPRVWWIGSISYTLFSAVFFGGLILIMTGAIATWPAGLLILVIYALGSVKGVLRLGAAADALAGDRQAVTRLWWMYCILWPLVSLLFMYNFLRSALTRRIEWRGVEYEMISPSETVVR